MTSRGGRCRRGRGVGAGTPARSLARYVEHGAAPQSDQAADEARSLGTVTSNPLNLSAAETAQGTTLCFSLRSGSIVSSPAFKSTSLQHFPRCSFTRFCNSVGDPARRDGAQTKARSAQVGWVLEKKDIKQCVDVNDDFVSPTRCLIFI